MRYILPSLALSLLALAADAANQAPVADLTKSLGDTQAAKPERAYVRRDDAMMQRWRGHRLGVMIHWGVYAIPGGSWKGKSHAYAAEWIKSAAGIPGAEYDQLLTQFNPTAYDPVTWARQFKQAGAKYVVITTKHHDGFCLFDSKFTDYDVGSTPHGKDLLRPLFDALRAEGLDVGVYYSIIDWHHPDFRAVLKSDDDRIAYGRYVQYMKDQVRELLTEYGDILTIWFDGRWDPAYKNNPQIGIDLEAWCRAQRPGLVVGDRVRAYDALADYDSGYERRLPTQEPQNDWESCMTMTENSWGYHERWTGNGWKTPRMIVELMTRCAAMNGNFLINIGPTAAGTIRPDETERLRRLGDWMAVNGEAIYGTTSARLKGLPEGIYATRKGDRLYLIVFRWPDTDRLQLKGLAIARAGRLTAEGEQAVAVDGDTLIGLPLDPPDRIATVFAIELRPPGTP